MDGLSDQVMSPLLDGEDESEAFFLNWVIAIFSPNCCSAQVGDGLLEAFIILLCEQSTQGMIHSSYIK